MKDGAHQKSFYSQIPHVGPIESPLREVLVPTGVNNDSQNHSSTSQVRNSGKDSLTNTSDAQKCTDNSRLNTNNEIASLPGSNGQSSFNIPLPTQSMTSPSLEGRNHVFQNQLSDLAHDNVTRSVEISDVTIWLVKMSMIIAIILEAILLIMLLS
ncbi:MAG: hypothetical protein U0175_04560 [Caldilineaceae bacterium]